MPTAVVDREDLFERLGRVYTDEEFDELCFQFGVELDDVLTEDAAKELRGATAEAGGVIDAGGKTGRVLYYIAIPANRYDLLCIEGIARALNIFLGRITPPVYRVVTPASPLSLTVKASTAAIRPFVVAAVLRGVTFNAARYASFIDLQDKLHNNICRKRTLVAIGTHDLDTVRPPFTYNALPPTDIEFVPLSQKRSFRADALMEFYRTDPSVKHIKPYVDIIADSAVYPVITDAAGTVLSLPPIINGHHSRISLDTKNVLIECTATDLTKAGVVLNTVVSMFSEYCAEPFSCEAVAVTYEAPVRAATGGVDANRTISSYVTPDLSQRVAVVSATQTASLIGAPISAEDAARLCTRMGLSGSVVPADPAARAAAAAEVAGGMSPTDHGPGDAWVRVLVPCTRADVLHECDVIEDVAIAYGYNALVKTIPKTLTTGEQLPINRLTDHLRREMALAGYDECLTLALCSRHENFDALLQVDDGKTAVVLSNPKSDEFQIGRTTMLPGLLKSLQSNRGASVRDGLKLFEVSDVMLLDASSDVGARNERRLAALYTGPTAGFEIIHGLVDRIMMLLEVPVRPYKWATAAATGGAGAGAGADADAGAAGPAAAAYGRGGLRYYVDPAAIPTYFPGRGASIVLERQVSGRSSGAISGGWVPAGEADSGSGSGSGVERVVAGSFGVLHPRVLGAFELSYPVSVVEINIEHFL